MFKQNLKYVFSDIYFILILLVCVILLVLKYPYFNLPYFSDELWAYGPAVRKMGLQVPSLLPTSLAVEDHWGHPMLFFFLGGLWGVVFGTSIFSTHVFASCLSITFILTCYLILQQIFTRKVAFYSLLIIVSQSIFLGQFNLVLPEITLTITIFLTMFFYIKNNTLGYLISACTLVLVKETGVLLVATIVLWHLLKSFLYDKRKIIDIFLIKELFFVILPIIALLTHILLLKFNYGWYIVPDRMEHFNFNWDDYYERIMRSFHYVFVGQGRKPIIIGLFIISILFNSRYKMWKRFLFLIVIFSAFKVFFNYWKLPVIIDVTIVPIIFIYVFKVLLWDNYKMNKNIGNFLGISSIFIIVYILFSSAQFDSIRYLFCLIPLFIIIAMFFVEQNIKVFNNLKSVVLVFVFVSFSIHYTLNDIKFGDDTLNYRDVCLIHKSTVSFLEENNFYDNNISCSFELKHALQRPLAGYLNSNNTFPNINKHVECNSKCESCIYIIDSANMINYSKQDQDIYETNFSIIFEKSIGVAWVKVYQKKPKFIDSNKI